MKTLICILFTFAYGYSQPGQSAHILIPIEKDNILKGDFANRYLMSLNVYQDTISNKEASSSTYYTYINGKNYHKFEIFNDQYLTVYPFIPTERGIPKNSIMQLSFLEKSSNKEMNIYIRLSRDFEFEMFLQLDKLIFFEGSYFFDSCQSKRRYRIESKNKRNYGTGKTDINDTAYPITEIIDMSKLSKHRITTSELNRFGKILF